MRSLSDVLGSGIRKNTIAVIQLMQVKFLRSCCGSHGNLLGFVCIFIAQQCRITSVHLTLANSVICHVPNVELTGFLSFKSFFACSLNARPLISIYQSHIRIQPQIWQSGEGACCHRGDISRAVRRRYVYLVLVTIIGLSGT